MRQNGDATSIMAPLEHKPQPTKNNWTSSKSETDSDENSETPMKPALSKSGSLKKKVSFQLANIRKYSLTGSLPDLATTSSADNNEDATPEENQVDLNIRRDPLPMGSDVFRAAMVEIDGNDDEVDDSGSNENIPDRLNHSWNCEKRVTRNNSRQRLFQSKTAAAIYSKIFVAPFPKTHRNKDNRLILGPSLKSSGDNSRISPDHSACSSLSSSPKISERTSHSALNTLASSPRVPTKHGLNSSHNTHKLSPLASSEIGSIRISSEKVGIRRQMSMPGESPRLLHRTKQHRYLGKSASLDL